MKIGVYYPGYIPESGGGYTFERSVLQSLFEISHESPHEFVIIHENASRNDSQQFTNGNLHEVIITRPRPRSRPARFMNKVINKIGLRTNLFSATDHSLTDAITQNKIEFMWFLTPTFFTVNIPYIATIWDIQHRVQPWFPEVGESAEWERRERYYSEYLKRAAYVITPNSASRDEIEFYYRIPKERLISLPHPTPKISLLEPTEVDKVLEKYQLSRQKFLLYPAQFWPHKNHINLLLALKILRDEYNISFPLVLVGSEKGNRQFVIERAKEIGVNDLVLFPGFIPEEDLVGLYQGAFALTFASFFGPENIPPLEAFCCGCPVIVNRVAGAEEQFQDSALLVDGTNPGEFAGAINSLYQNNQLRKELITKGHSRAESFTANDYVRGVFSALNRFEGVRRSWGFEYHQTNNKVTKK